VERGVNLLLDPADYIPRSILIFGSWQPKVGKALSNWLTEGSVMLDIGAHIGYFALKASALVGKDGRVIAFEPNPKTLKKLHANIAASGATNIIVQPVACTDYEQVITLHDSTECGHSGLSSFLPITGQENYSEVLPSYNVRGRPIDEIVPELGLTRIDVVKVDVEGAETMVIRGARETLKLFHPVVVMEMSDSRLREMGLSLEELAALMMELGYTQHRVMDSWDEDVKDWEWVVQ
jgi:FkbM family methyltransferase